MQLQEGPVLLVTAVSRLDQHVTHVSGCSSGGNPQRPAVAVLSVHLDQLQRGADTTTRLMVLNPLTHSHTAGFSSGGVHHSHTGLKYSKEMIQHVIQITLISSIHSFSHSLLKMVL